METKLEKVLDDKYMDVSLDEISKIINLKYVSDYISNDDVNFLSRELYTSRGLGFCMIKKKRYARILKKLQVKCKYCGASCFRHEIYCYVDGNNISITKNSPELCKDCYQKNYGNF